MRTTLLPKPLTDLVNAPGVQDLMHFNPDAPGAIRGSCRTILAGNYDRNWLAQTLVDYNKRIGNDDAAIRNAWLLTQSEATAVVTGQQAGMFTGPIYTILKAATAIKLAEQQTAELNQPVVPIFWNATEDHDLSEIATCSFPGKEWRADLPDHGIAAERLPAGPCLELARELLEACSDQYGEELDQTLTGEFEDYGSYSSAVLARIFAGTGLVILEPRLLRPRAVDFLQDCVRRRDSIRKSLKQGAEALNAIGVDPSFEPGSGFGLFHLGENGQRRQVVETEGELALDGAPIDEDELIRMIGETPEDFSTGAYLRPILQSLLLPNLAFVAGPGEFRYHLQLGRLYQLFDATMPLLRLRNHATFLGPPERRAAQKLGLSAEDYFRPATDIYRQVDLPEETSQVFDQAKGALDQMAAAITDGAGELVGDRAVANFQKKAGAELEKVRQRALREFKRSREVDNGRIDRFRQAVFPGVPQERRINIFYFLQYKGLSMIRDLIAALDPQEQDHYVIHLD